MSKSDLILENTKSLTRRDVLKTFGIAAASGLLTANSIVPATAQTQKTTAETAPNLQGAGFYKFKVGQLECLVVSDGSIKSPPLPTFAANAPKAEVENALRDYFLATNEITLDINTLVVKSGSKILLIDTGSGAFFGPKAGLLKINLKRAGIEPEAVTDVVFTHAHLDHAGGNVDSNGGIVYPNARFHIAQKEWETWTAKNVNLGKTQVDDAARKFFIEGTQKNLLPIKDRVTIFKPGAEIVTGVSSVAATGHTPGHTAYLVASGSESLLHAGDFAHNFVLQIVHPEWYVGVDFDPQQAVATRKKLLDRAATDRTLLVGSHMPFPGIGHIRARNAARTSYEWVPIAWEWGA